MGELNLLVAKCSGTVIVQLDLRSSSYNSKSVFTRDEVLESLREDTIEDLKSPSNDVTFHESGHDLETRVVNDVTWNRYRTVQCNDVDTFRNGPIGRVKTLHSTLACGLSQKIGDFLGIP